MSSYKTLNALVDETAAGSIVLFRADLNVPLDESGIVRDATRLQRLLPSLEKLSQSGFRIGVLSHFGRPKGRRVAEMSLAPIASALGDLLGQDVAFAEDCIGDAAQNALTTLPEGGICVLENTRFHAGEEADDADFAAALAAPAQAYVNDAFSAAHRAHASTHGITKYVPTYCGLAMQAELDALNAALGNPKRPLIAIVGGAKISTKLDLLGNLSAKTDTLVIGGGMANTFLAAQGHNVGTSLCEDSMLDTARAIMAEAEKQDCTILLPRDAVVASQFAAGQSGEICAAQAVPDNKMILDAGPDAVSDICAAFDKAATLIWNGPLGAFEIEPFDAATNKAAQYAAALTRKGQLTSIAGGGDTVAALNHAGAGDDFSYVSTAGGAFLEWLEGKTLPGIAALAQE
ncbi:MAG: Phosphoglycerate kinase [Alphaproteobacteria bacterium]|nr:MAG: Phosphoglycerate kinase [Alphaproteobacteria bacterium]